MLMHAYNELNIDLILKTESPLIIKEGRYTDQLKKDWAGLDKHMKDRMPNVIPVSRASFDEMRRAICDSNPVLAVGRLPFYIPGSSMRGAWRSSLERVLRSLDEPGSARVCDPFQEEDKNSVESCSSVLTRRQDNKESFVPYAVSCPVCRLFGSTLQSSRISIGDGELDEKNRGRIVAREHTRINRHDGRVTGAPLRFLGLQDASFKVRIRLRNFELFHMFLLGLLLKDLELKNLPLGSGKNKGYGQVAGEFKTVVLTYFGLERPDNLLRGIAESGPRWRADYGLLETVGPPQFPHANWSEPIPWRHEIAFNDKEFETLWRAIKLNQMPPLTDRMRHALEVHA